MQQPYSLTQHLHDNHTITYGIASATMSYPDIHENRQAIEDLVNLCNEEQLDPVHMPEILENFFAYIGDPAWTPQPDKTTIAVS